MRIDHLVDKVMVGTPSCEMRAVREPEGKVWFCLTHEVLAANNTECHVTMDRRADLRNVLTRALPHIGQALNSGIHPGRPGPTHNALSPKFNESEEACRWIDTGWDRALAAVQYYITAETEIRHG